MIRVCLVEDQTIVREELRSLLEMVEDVEVVAEAADGEEALHLTREHSPDVVLLDVKLPKLDGLQVLKRIKEDGKLPATIILTTFDDDEIVLEGVRLGVKGFLLKDVSLDQLTSAIRQGSPRRDDNQVRSYEPRTKGIAGGSEGLSKPRPARSVERARGGNPWPDVWGLQQS